MMSKDRFILYLSLLFILSACQETQITRSTLPSQDKQDVKTATQQSASLESITPSFTPTVPLKTTTPLPTKATMMPVLMTATKAMIDCTLTDISPVFVYMEGNTLYKIIGCDPPQEVAGLGPYGPLKDVLQVGNFVYLLREQAIERVNLAKGNSEPILTFNEPIHGQLMKDPDNLRFFYVVINHETTVGWVGLENSDSREILSSPRPLSLLGKTENGQGLYYISWGQDPSFDHILVMDIKLVVTSIDLPVEGYGWPALAPNRRTMATLTYDTDDSMSRISFINLYNLSTLPESEPQVFELPIQPSDIGSGGFHWSPDSQEIYFLLIKDFSEDIETIPANELWSLDVTNGKMTQIVPEFDMDYGIQAISPDGEWLLLQDGMLEEALLVNLQTGEIQTFFLPVMARHIGWQ
jgi:hypothetical protein